MILSIYVHLGFSTCFQAVLIVKQIGNYVCLQRFNNLKKINF
jgi:hypothetical protein